MDEAYFFIIIFSIGEGGGGVKAGCSHQGNGLPHSLCASTVYIIDQHFALCCSFCLLSMRNS